MPMPPDLLKLAALGTGAGGDMPEVGPALTPLLDQLRDRGVEARLLLAAAAIALRQQAGWVAPHASRPLPEACPPDETLPCGQEAVRHLQVMLRGHYREALPEWLREVAQAGKRAPEESLPLLLEAGVKQEALRDLILPVIGRRGQWLAAAATTRQWGWAARRDIEKSWMSDSAEERVALIRWLRQGDPARARQLVSETWSGERAAQRAELIGAFAHGLSLDDEPFLEAALDDRAQAVRRVAAEQLARLSGSRFQQRMIGRATSLLSLPRLRLKRAPAIAIRLASSFDEGARRDGLDEDPPVGLLREAWLAQQILSYVPPAFWCQRWDLSEEALLAAAPSRSPVNLIEAWAWAAHRGGDASFAALLLRSRLDALSEELIGRLVDDLPPELRESVIVEWLEKQRGGFRADHPALPLLLAHQGRWSHELTRAFLASLGRYLKRGRVRPDPRLRSALLAFARSFPPEMMDEIIGALDVETSAERAWPEMIDEIRLLLDFRRQMLAAIHE